MRRRYIQHMQKIQPSPKFLHALESEMNQELRSNTHAGLLPKALTAAGVIAAAVLAVAGIGALRSNNPDIISPPPVVAAKPTSTAAIETTHFTENDALILPDEPNKTAPAATDSQVTEIPTAEPTIAVTYPPEDVRLELQMGTRQLYTNHDVIREPSGMLMTENNLIGVSGSPLIEIHQSAELNSVVMAPLRPGDAFWPVKNENAIIQLTDANGNGIGYTELVQYYNEELNTVKEGWKHTIYEISPLEVPENPVERIMLPGEVIADNTLLRYGRNADAPAVAVLQKDQFLGLAYRVGNWIYASTEPFCFGYETPVTGWIHITEVLGASWHMNLNHVELLADSVNLRDKPDGQIVASLTKDSIIYYTGDTVPGKNGDWHYVSVNGFKGTQNGYISADYAKLYVFPLENKLNMDSVISATLRYSDTSPFSASEQSIEGEKLALLMDRLRNARSAYVYQTVCGEGAASLTLTYSDGSEVLLPLSGDSCTQVRYGAVTYDLKTDQERTESFLNDGGASLSDILSPVFDQINFP